MQHAMMTALLHNRLFWAPIDPELKQVIDLGTGTGIWAIEFAELVITIFMSSKVNVADLGIVPGSRSSWNRFKSHTTRLGAS